MNTRRTTFRLSQVPTWAILGMVASTALAVACGSDDDSAGGGGGAGGASAGTGGKATGGAGGKATGGAPGAGAPGGGAAHGGAPGGGAPANDAGSAGEEAGGAAGAGDAGAPSIDAFGVKLTNLVSDQDNVATTKDDRLTNAWAIAINPGAQVFWVSSNHGGSTPVYGADGSIKPVDPTVAPVAGADPGSPTGQVFNAGANFKGDKFIVDTEDGQIMGWAAGAAFTQRALTATAIYKGLALVGTGATQQLLAANFHDGSIDIFDVNYAAVAAPTAFKDATIPAGFAPFNVVAIADKVYVAYAKQDADKEDDVAGAGNGYVTVFDAAGVKVKSWLAGGKLNSPWAISPAPTGFGVPAGALLVGNFGDGKIGAYDADGTLIGELTNSAGTPVVIPGLWDLKVGPPGTVDLSTTLFFSAGPAGETHGLFGKLEAAALQ